MNVMKQDAMDDKIIERCKTCEKKKTMHARGSRQIKKLSSCYWADANLDGSRICQGSIGQIESFSMDWRSYRDSVEKNSRNLDGLKLC